LPPGDRVLVIAASQPPVPEAGKMKTRLSSGEENPLHVFQEPWKARYYKDEGLRRFLSTEVKSLSGTICLSRHVQRRPEKPIGFY